MKNVIGLNGKEKKGKLTVEELREYKGFENFSDAEANDYIESMELFCIIAYEMFNSQKLNTDGQDK